MSFFEYECATIFPNKLANTNIPELNTFTMCPHCHCCRNTLFYGKVCKCGAVPCETNNCSKIVVGSTQCQFHRSCPTTDDFYEQLLNDNDLDNYFENENENNQIVQRSNNLRNYCSLI